jgi:hypothetical protein
MTAPVLDLAASVPALAAIKKKRVLLIDTSSRKRELRAEIMRKLGIEVDCAADIAEARSWWRADLYNLVLINVQSDIGLRDDFCGDVRSAIPPQQLAFLVGKPEYLAHSPNADTESPADLDQSLVGDVRKALSADLGDMPQRWGILEASRRISAVRSACSARTSAMRERPDPPRDLEMRHAKRAAAPTRTFDELLREELQ